MDPPSTRGDGIFMRENVDTGRGGIFRYAAGANVAGWGGLLPLGVLWWDGSLHAGSSSLMVRVWPRR